jgi:hypothetical protein
MRVSGRTSITILPAGQNSLARPGGLSGYRPSCQQHDNTDNRQGACPVNVHQNLCSSKLRHFVIGLASFGSTRSGLPLLCRS